MDAEEEHWQGVAVCSCLRPRVKNRHEKLRTKEPLNGEPHMKLNQAFLRKRVERKRERNVVRESRGRWRDACKDRLNVVCSDEEK